MNDRTRCGDNLTCGDCYYWREVDEAANGPNNHDPKAPIQGLCYFNPPRAFLTQGRHQITGEVTMATMTVRPPLNSTEPCCGQFELAGAILT